MQAAVLICIIGPVGSGEVEVRSVHVNWPGGPMGATWPLHNPTGYTEVEKSMCSYGRANFSAADSVKGDNHNDDSDNIIPDTNVRTLPESPVEQTATPGATDSTDALGHHPPPPSPLIVNASALAGSIKNIDRHADPPAISPASDHPPLPNSTSKIHIAAVTPEPLAESDLGAGTNRVLSESRPTSSSMPTPQASTPEPPEPSIPPTSVLAAPPASAPASATIPSTSEPSNFTTWPKHIKDAYGYFTKETIAVDSVTVVHTRDWGTVNDTPTIDMDWGKLNKAGRNGFLLIMLSLVWWGKVTGRDEGWRKTVMEVLTILHCMLGSVIATPGVIQNTGHPLMGLNIANTAGTRSLKRCCEDGLEEGVSTKKKTRSH
ncbi:hypothetical protein PILCRDRAFT_86556 [Piloderma croceum F 1598]|uniref:Uncharacterized protein n=1 Tax=Piloderma croceum (strain F 1598) TaxID=765440 RepID=A0A0C3FQF9_PILCF|nr:hypothetical protein PILCRDRAFT_86556 [Piloderma croceum F 1598]